MENPCGKFFKCIVPSYPAFQMGRMECIIFTFEGAENGWYTLRNRDGGMVMLAGEEIKEVE